jgi:putative FmdB family regulatory protein
MPLYEYECDACGTRFEKIVRFSDPPLEACPSCGGTVRKLMSSPAIQFKGTGWYITDYAKKDSGREDRDGASVDASSSKSEKGEKAEKSEAGSKGEKSEKSEKTDSGKTTESSGQASSTPASSTTSGTSTSSTAKTDKS